MCVIAQTPLISPFGSIGFREREKERGWEEGWEAESRGGLQGTQRRGTFLEREITAETLDFNYK